jgi:hypothetical protein
MASCRFGIQVIVMELKRDCDDNVLDYRSTFNSQESGEEEDEKPDSLPEHCDYRDEGCELAISCLNCPFTICILDQPGGKQRWRKRLRDTEIIRLFSSEGKKTGELAQRFGVSLRTVQRVLRRNRSE